MTILDGLFFVSRKLHQSNEAIGCSQSVENLQGPFREHRLHVTMYFLNLGTVKLCQ